LPLDVEDAAHDDSFGAARLRRDIGWRTGLGRDDYRTASQRGCDDRFLHQLPPLTTTHLAGLAQATGVPDAKHLRCNHLTRVDSPKVSETRNKGCPILQRAPGVQNRPLSPDGNPPPNAAGGAARPFPPLQRG